MLFDALDQETVDSLPRLSELHEAYGVKVNSLPVNELFALYEQTWFRPENRFPARVFGSMVETIGGSFSSVQRHAYFVLPRTLSLPSGGGIRIVAYNPSHEQALAAIASAARGSVYVAAEELAGDV